MTAANIGVQVLQKTLPDIVKGIRANKKNEKEYIQKCIMDIKEELKHKEFHVKVIAVQKMTYLHMIGYDMEYGAFQIIEVMSRNEDFGHKRIGYLACAQCFHRDIEVLPLVTNLLKKDLMSANQYEAGLALSCLSNICTPDLARDLAADVANLLTSGRSYIRKKTLLTLFKIFLQFPEALKATFPRIKDKLEDSDPSVVAASVNVLCELARRNPANYLGMAPVFFKLLTSLHNNWTLIKIVKLFGALVPLEQRLGKKLSEPLANIINTTPAKSLLYECCSTVVHGMHKQTSLLRLSVEKLKQFVEDPDQNLKYLGLLGLTKVMSSNPKMLVDLRDTVVECLSDEDVTIRMRALELASGLVTKKNLHQTVAKILEQLHKRLDDDEFTNMLVKHVIETCRQQDYAFITSFEWYLRVLMDITQAKIGRFRHGALVESEFMSVAARVRGVRPFAVKCMAALLTNPGLYQRAADGRSDVARVLKTAAYVVSEYPRWAERKAELIAHLVKRRVLSCDPDVQSAVVHAVLKLYAHICDPPDSDSDHDQGGDDGPSQRAPSDRSTAQAAYDSLFPSQSDAEPIDGAAAEPEQGLAIFLASCDVDVQEHATSVQRLVRAHYQMLQDGSPVSLCSVFAEPLRLVAPGAQEQIQPPEGLDLDEQIIDYHPPSSEEDSFAAASSDDLALPSGGESRSNSSSSRSGGGRDRRRREQRAAEKRRRRQEADRRRHDPHYLPSAGGAEPRGREDSGDDLPGVTELPKEVANELGTINLGVGGFKDKKAKKERGAKRDGRKAMDTEFEAPEGYASPQPRAKEEKQPDGEQDQLWRALDFDLSGPAHELPTVKPYVRTEAKDFDGGKGDKKDKRDKKDKKDRKDKKDKKDKKGDDRDRDRDGDREKDRDRDRRRRRRQSDSDEEAGGEKGAYDQVLADEHVLEKRREHRKEKKEAHRRGSGGGKDAEDKGREKAGGGRRDKDRDRDRDRDKDRGKAKDKDKDKDKDRDRRGAADRGEKKGRSERKTVDLEGPEARELRRRLKRWLADVPIGGSAGSTTKRKYDPTPLVEFALRRGLEGEKPEALYRAYVEEKGETAELPTPPPAAAAAAAAAAPAAQRWGHAASGMQPPRGSITSAEFAAAMQRLNRAQAEAAKREVPVASLAEGLALVSERLRLVRVEVFDSCASLYGTHSSPAEGEQPVCVLAKAAGPDRLSIEVKCAPKGLAAALADEAAALFGGRGGGGTGAVAPEAKRKEDVLDFLDM